MKIIHCADVHLDSSQMPAMTKEQVNIRKMEILHTFTRMADYAAENDVHIILISGGLFGTRNIAAGIRNQVRECILAHPQIDFIYLQGHPSNDNFLTRLDELPANLLLFGPGWQSYVYGRIAVCGRESNDGDFSSMELDPSLYNVVMYQGEISGEELQKLKNRSLRYLALGGKSCYQFGQLDTRGYLCYPGSLEGRNFEECDEHGFILLDIDETSLHVSYSFVPFARRNYYVLEVDISGAAASSDAIARINQRLKMAAFSPDSLVQLVLTGTLEVDSRVNLAEIRKQFEGYYFYLEILEKTELTLENVEYEKDASLRGEFIRTVMKSELDDRKKLEIIRCGVQILAGEEM